MTLERWLAGRHPAPPAALAARLREQLGPVALMANARDAAEVLARAGEAVLGGLLRDQCTTRASALDLLAADALVTYAFEAAAERPDELPARAREAMRRIAQVPAASVGPAA